MCVEERNTSPSVSKKYCSQDCYHKSRRGIKRPEHSIKMKHIHATSDVFAELLKPRKLSELEKKNISIRMKNKWKDKNDIFNSDEYRQSLSDHAMSLRRKGKFNNSGHPSSSGWYEINGKKYYFRSSWEVLYARYLEFLLISKEIKKWEYEPETFWFNNIKRGVRSYLPDFRITKNNEEIEYHEIKGWMDDKSKTKIKRMAKYYPDVILLIFKDKEIKGIKRTEYLYPAAIEIEKPADSEER